MLVFAFCKATLVESLKLRKIPLPIDECRLPILFRVCFMFVWCFVSVFSRSQTVDEFLNALDDSVTSKNSEFCSFDARRVHCCSSCESWFSIFLSHIFVCCCSKTNPPTLFFFVCVPRMACFYCTDTHSCEMYVSWNVESVCHYSKRLCVCVSPHSASPPSLQFAFFLVCCFMCGGGRSFTSIRVQCEYGEPVRTATMPHTKRAILCFENFACGAPTHHTAHLSCERPAGEAFWKS